MPLPQPAYTTDPPPMDSDASTSTTPSLSGWTAPPVTIHINASIHIEGTLNQIALPPHPSSHAIRVIGNNVNAAAGSFLDYLGSPEVTANRMACDRAEQISNAVLQALKDSGALAGTVMPMRALEVNVDASVTVKGERNVLTTNVQLRSTGGAASETPTPVYTGQRAVARGQEGWGRVRRCCCRVELGAALERLLETG